MSNTTPTETSKPKVDPGLRVLLRNQGVYNLYLKIIALFWISLGVMIVSILVSIFFFLQKTPPQYVQASMDGKIIQSVPLDKPNMDEAGIFDFSRKAITALNRYDYINYKSQIPEAQKYFTPTGWIKYLEQLKARSTLKTVEAQRDIVSVEFTGPATLAKSTVLDLGGGHLQFVWVVEEPIAVNYIAHSNTSSNGGLIQRGIAQMVIVRVPYTDSPEGVSIQLFNFLENKS